MQNVSTKLYVNSIVEDETWPDQETAFKWAMSQHADKIEIYDSSGNLIDEILPKAADENPNAVPPAITE